MKTAGRRNPNRWATAPCTPSQGRDRSEQISLAHVGWEARKTPAAGEVFFLDFPLYRTSQALALRKQELGAKQMDTVDKKQASTGNCFDSSRPRR
jgi:hypothetical protein